MAKALAMTVIVHCPVDERWSPPGPSGWGFRRRVNGSGALAEFGEARARTRRSEVDAASLVRSLAGLLNFGDVRRRQKPTHFGPSNLSGAWVWNGCTGYL